MVTYEGLCEQFKYQKADNPTASPLDTRVRDPRLKPWLKATPTTMATPQEKFKQQFFVANRTGGWFLDVAGLMLINFLFD